MMNTLGVTHNDMLKAARAKDGKKEKKVSTKAALGKNKTMGKKGKGHKSGTVHQQSPSLSVRARTHNFAPLPSPLHPRWGRWNW